MKGKWSKEKAAYKGKSPSKHCVTCTMFRGPDTCTAVEGHINPKGSCRLYEKKSGHPKQGAPSK